MTGIEQAIHAIGSQAKLAEALGCSQQNVSMMLRNGYAPIKWVRAIEQATGVSRDLLIDPSLLDLLAPADV